MALLESKKGKIIYYKQNQKYDQNIFDDERRYFFLGFYVPNPDWTKYSKSYLIKTIADITGRGIKETAQLLKDASHENPIEIDWEHIIPIHEELKESIHFVAQSDFDEFEDHEIEKEKKEWEERKAKLQEAEEWVKTLSEKEQEYIEVIKGSMITIASPF